MTSFLQCGGRHRPVPRRLLIALLVLVAPACGDPPNREHVDDDTSLEARLEQLQQVGIRMRPGITIEHLLASSDREHLEASLVNLLVALGGFVEKEPYPDVSDDVWYFDTECIYDNGAYVRIARRVQGLAAGRLKLVDLEDEVDVQKGVARLAFRVGEQRYKWDLEVSDDWVDTAIFGKMSDVLSKHAPGLRFIHLDLGGQDMLLLLGDAARLEKLRSTTGLDFEWLTL